MALVLEMIWGVDLLMSTEQEVRIDTDVQIDTCKEHVNIAPESEEERKAQAYERYDLQPSSN